MTRPSALSVEQLRERVGQEIGISDWLAISQEMINAFADATLDHQFIHVDPEQAEATPFGTTVAHGLLTASLLPRLCFDTVSPIAGAEMEINYGFDRLRFVSPVPSGSRVRARFTLKDLEQKSVTQVLRTYSVTVEIEGAGKPALVADWLMLTLLTPPAH